MVRSAPVGKLEQILVGQIRALAAARGLAISRLADQAGISRSSMWEVTSGRASPTLAWIQRVADVLEVDARELLTGVPVKLSVMAANPRKKVSPKAAT